MTRALTISLLLFFLADAVGCILFLFVDWYEIRKEMSHFLGSKDLDSKAVTLTFDQEEWAKVQWIEKDREFLYKGKMYDIISSQKENDITKIRCVVDEREASFFQTMGKLVSHSQSDSKEHSLILSVFKFLSTLVFQFTVFPTLDNRINIRASDVYSNHYSFFFHSLSLRPPDQVSFSI